jgi:Predicted ATPase
MKILQSTRNQLVIGTASEIPPVGTLIQVNAGNNRAVAIATDVSVITKEYARVLAESGVTPSANMNVGEKSIAAQVIGHFDANGLYHQVPAPVPPEGLAEVTYLAANDTKKVLANIGYIKSLVNAKDLDGVELAASHIIQTHKEGVMGADWIRSAIRSVITALRSDPDRLLSFSAAVAGLPDNCLPTAEELADVTKVPVGYITGGTVGTLIGRLVVPPHTLQEGSFITIKDDSRNFFGLLGGFELGATAPAFAEGFGVSQLPTQIQPAVREQTLFANFSFVPAVMLENGKTGPVKTIPSHHAQAYQASAGDIRTVFGDPTEPQNFVIGYTREQRHPVSLDLDKFVQRSSGVFGASGTGKSFLVRLILAGLIKHDKSSLLVLDMHNEYGFDDTASDTGLRVTGLRTKYPGRVVVVGLGAKTTIRGSAPDLTLEIPMNEIMPADIELLTEELGLKETTATSLDALYKDYGSSWFSAFKKMQTGATVVEVTCAKCGHQQLMANAPTACPKCNDTGIRVGKPQPAATSVQAFANSAGINTLALEGLHAKLHRVFGKHYIVEKTSTNGIDQIIKMLEAGQHVVLSFGRFETDLDYLLVSNILTRKIREAWEKKTNEYRAHAKAGTKPPRQLMIVVEEAHKLLSNELAKQTTFGTIARELRKYYVTLLIVDQRPSQISSEVMSQIGTRISGWLGDEDDIHSALVGQPARETLKSILARLRAKEEILIFGWGVPMPLPISTRVYDDNFWLELLKGVKLPPVVMQGGTPSDQPVDGEAPNTPAGNGNDLLSGLGF